MKQLKLANIFHTHICNNPFRNMVDGCLRELVVQYLGFGIWIKWKQNNYGWCRNEQENIVAVAGIIVFSSY